MGAVPFGGGWFCAAFALAAKRKMVGATGQVATGTRDDKEKNKRRAKTAVGEWRTGVRVSIDAHMGAHLFVAVGGRFG